MQKETAQQIYLGSFFYSSIMPRQIKPLDKESA